MVDVAEKNGQTAMWKQKALEARSLNCFQGLYQIGSNPFFCDELLTVCFCGFEAQPAVVADETINFFFHFLKVHTATLSLTRKILFQEKGMFDSDK